MRIRMTSDGILGGILGLLALITVTLHILMASRPLTSLETSLFNVLQFLFSVSFAWILSRSSSKREFTESQKQFAIAAYRRICEIDAATSRLIARIRSRFPDASIELSNELHVLSAIALGIRQSAKSSISDWAEIIGEEIVAMKQIAELKDEQDALLSPRQTRTGSDPDKDWETVTARLTSLEKELDLLTEKLPLSLRVLSASDVLPENGVSRACSSFFAQFEEKGFVDLRGFWEPEGGFERSVREYSPGTQMTVEYGDAGSRIGALLLKDASGLSVGVITNPFQSRYHEFASALTVTVGRSSFPATLVKVRDSDEETGWVRFQVRVSRDDRVELVS